MDNRKPRYVTDCEIEIGQFIASYPNTPNEQIQEEYRKCIAKRKPRFDFSKLEPMTQYIEQTIQYENQQTGMYTKLLRELDTLRNSSPSMEQDDRISEQFAALYAYIQNLLTDQESEVENLQHIIQHLKEFKQLAEYWNSNRGVR